MVGLQPIVESEQSTVEHEGEDTEDSAETLSRYVIVLFNLRVFPLLGITELRVCTGMPIFSKHISPEQYQTLF